MKFNRTIIALSLSAAFSTSFAQATVTDTTTTGPLAVGQGASSTSSGSACPLGVSGIDNGEVALGQGARASDCSASAGGGARAQNRGTAFGVGSRAGDPASSALGGENVAVGFRADAPGLRQTITGARAAADIGATGATISGAGANSAAPNTVVSGADASAGAFASGSVLVGAQAQTGFSNNVGIGFRVSLGAPGNVVTNSVALGANSVSLLSNEVSVGSSTLQRRIANVASATQATDAVNLGQLNAVDTRLSGRITAVEGTATVALSEAARAHTRIDTTNARVDNVERTANTALSEAGRAHTRIDNLDNRVTTEIGRVDQRITQNFEVTQNQLNQLNLNLTQIDNRVTSEVNRLDSRIDALQIEQGITRQQVSQVMASTMAINMPQPQLRNPGDYGFSAGVGHYGGANALAAGIYAMGPSGRSIASVKVTATASGKSTRAGVSAGIAWTSR